MCSWASVEFELVFPRDRSTRKEERLLSPLSGEFSCGGDVVSVRRSHVPVTGTHMQEPQSPYKKLTLVFYVPVCPLIDEKLSVTHSDFS